MTDLFPPFDWQLHVIEPWTEYPEIAGWAMLMGFFVTGACGLVGIYLLLRRMALVGDAISHSVLPGLVFAFLLFRNTSTSVMFLGAVTAGMVTVFLIEFIHRQSRVKPDAAICIAFTLLFSLGVVMISQLESAGSFHIDAECVLYGEIGFVGLEPPVIFKGAEMAPAPVLRMGAVMLGVMVLIIVFYKELLVTSFDSGLAKSLGMRTGIWHYGLMAVLSIVIVAAFESVGAILAIAMLIVPPMFAAQLTSRMLPRIFLVLIHAALSSVIGYHLSVWLECSSAGAMTVAASGLFITAWMGTALKSVIVRSISVSNR